MTMNPDSKNENEFPCAAVLPSSVSPQWIELPLDVTANILQRLEPLDILKSADKVCTTWRKICCDPSMWRVLKLFDKHDDFSNERILHFWFRAVDLSQGQLLQLSIGFFWDFDLLNYVIDRSSNLKRLTLKHCGVFTLKVVVESANKLPHLEELSLICMLKIEASDIIAIGNAYPLLNSFSFNQHGYAYYHPGFLHPRSINNSSIQETNRNEYALAIAKNMPNLCHLRLIANSINDEGLEAILDGCPNLHSLDLRQCLELDLRGALGKRCSKQIKHLKFPADSVTSIEYFREPFITCYYFDDSDDDDDFDDAYNFEYMNIMMNEI